MNSFEVPPDAERQLSTEAAEQIVIVGGRTYPEQAQQAAEHIGTAVGDIDLMTFPNGELYAEFGESVRGKQVFIVQTDYRKGSSEKGGPWSINDSVQETVIMVDAAARASAKEVTVVKPYFAYSRQDRKSKGRESVAAAAHIDQYRSVGMDRLVTVEVHSAQTGSAQQKFDDLPGANRLARSLRDYINEEEVDINDVVFVAPDGGSLRLPTFYAKKLGGGRAEVMQKTRHADGTTDHHASRLEGVGGRAVVLVDDMIDTAGTIVSAAEILAHSGAERIIMVATHGLLSDPALEKFANTEFDKLIVTDTVPQNRAMEALGDRLIVKEIGTLIGKAIFEIGTDGSISSIFENNEPYRR